MEESVNQREMGRTGLSRAGQVGRRTATEQRKRETEQEDKQGRERGTETGKENRRTEKRFVRKNSEDG